MNDLALLLARRCVRTCHARHGRNMAARAATTVWRRPMVVAVGIFVVPAALTARTWQRSRAGEPATSSAAPGRFSTSLTGWLPAADAGPRAWGSLAAVAFAPGLAVGLAVGLAPLARPGADPITARQLQGVGLGVAALGVATALVACAGWVGKMAVYSALGVQDASGFIAEMRIRVPVLAQFWQRQIRPVKAALEPATVTMGERFQAAVDSIGLEHIAEQLGLDISVDADDSDPLGELGDDPLQTLVDRVSNDTFAEASETVAKT